MSRKKAPECPPAMGNPNPFHYGAVPGREITPSTTSPYLFTGDVPPTNTQTQPALQRHPLADDLNLSDEQLARLGLIVPAETPTPGYAYTLDSDSDNRGSHGSSSSRSSNNHDSISPEQMHSTKHWKKMMGPSHEDRSSTSLNPVAEEPHVLNPIFHTTTNSPTSTTHNSAKKHKGTHPEDVHASIAKFITAIPRLSPMEYARLYYVEKARCDLEGTPCPLPQPEAYWAWTENYEKFLCVPKVPSTINRSCFVTNLDNASHSSSSAKNTHAEPPTLRQHRARHEKSHKTVRKVKSSADSSWGRLARLATESTTRFFGRGKARSEDRESRAPVLPLMDFGETELDEPEGSTETGVSQVSRNGEDDVGDGGSEGGSVLEDILTAYDSPHTHWSNEPADERNASYDTTGHNPSFVNPENEPGVENDTPLDNDVTSDYCSSVYSEDELEGVNRRVYRVSSDSSSSSSLYSNNEPGVGGSINPFTEDSAPRTVSLALGFNGSSVEATQDDHSPKFDHHEPELPRAPTPAQYHPSAPLLQRPDWTAIPLRPRVSTPTPTPTPASAYTTLPQQTDWTPVMPRLSAALHPNRTPPDTPLPPAVPPRKRPCLTGEEMSAIVKRADAALQTSQLSTGNVEMGQEGLSTPSGLRAPELVPDGLRVDRVRNSESPAFSGYSTTPQLMPATQSEFKTTPTLSHAGPINENFQLAPNKRRRNIAPDRATYHITSPNQEPEAARQNFSPQSDTLSSPARHLAAGDAHSALTQRVPTPFGYPHFASASRESLADSDVSIWHPAPMQARTWNVSAVFGPAQTSEMKASTPMQDREDMMQGSERPREMESGYSNQRAAHRPSKSTDMSDDFGPGLIAVDSASGNRFVRADHPSYQDSSRSPPPKVTFKEKMRGLKKGTAKLTGILKLRKSLKDIRNESKAPEGTLDKTSMDSGRKMPGVMKKVRSIPSFASLRQRSHMDLRKAAQDGEAPPVPAIPLRHRKTSAQVAGERKA